MALATLTAEQIGLKANPNQHIPRIQTDTSDIIGLGKLKYEVLSDKTVDMDVVKAAEYIDLPVFPGERPVSDHDVQTLFDHMRNGTFNELLVILSTAIYMGVIYKINGQHTAWAVTFMNEVRKGFKLRVREVRYRVASEDQLRLLYSTYDRLKIRTDAHMSKVFLINTPATEGIGSGILSTIASAFKYWYIPAPAERQRTHPEQLTAIIQREHAALFKAVAKFVQTHHDEKFATRVPLVAAMFETFNIVPTKAAEFWEPVISGVGLPGKTDPRYGLRDILIESATRKHSRTEKRAVTQEDLYRIAVSAWNKWRRNEKIQAAIRVPSERPNAA